MSNVKMIVQQKTDTIARMVELNARAESENRDLTAEEKVTYAGYRDEIGKLAARVERANDIRDLELQAVAASGPREVGSSSGSAGAKAVATPFKSFGEQLIAIAQAGKPGRVADDRLHLVNENFLSAGPLGMNEAVPSDGGFFVQPDFATEFLKRMYDNGEILARTKKIPISSNANGIVINAVDESSRANGSRMGGLQVYWVNEADNATPSKPKFRKIDMRLEKLMGLFYSTDELQADASALQAVVADAFPEEMLFVLEDALLNGTGAGQPMGILNSAALITVAKDSADSTATISTKDVLSMNKHGWRRSNPNYAWFINQDTVDQLYPLTLGTGTAVQLLYTPPGTGNNATEYGRLLGRPVIETEHNATLGTPGDIILADMSQYLVIDKGGPQAAVSLHVAFLSDQAAYRWTLRVNGESIWNSPLTPKNGSNTLSPFIALATRP